IAKYPDGREEILLSVPKYDFNWQNTYIPKQPYKLPAGTVLETVGHYDNSVRNKVNPMPNRPALWSEQTADQLYNAWTEITYDAETSPNLNTAEVRTGSAEASKNNPITTLVGCVAPTADISTWRMTSASKLEAPPAPAGQTAAAAALRITHNVTKEEK